MLKRDKEAKLYDFELAVDSDLKTIYSLIHQRIKWMDMQGIEQWNKSNYWACYPKEYYVQSIEDKKLYVLKQIEDNQVAGAVVLSSCDKRWKDDDKALYLHNFVTSIDAQNAGSSILEFCSELAQRSGKAYLRLDCAISNKKLNDYYEAKGFVYVEPIIDGAYKGVKREKKLI